MKNMIQLMQNKYNMKLKLIKSTEDYQKALKRLDKIFHAKIGSKEQEHIRTMANKPFEAPENSVERKAAMRMDQINNYRTYNHGFEN